MKIRFSLSWLVVLALTSGSCLAYESEPFFESQSEKNADQWNAQDSEVNKKLALLEARFGKKPNIIYILADDIGWGELGSYGGGKVRGTPTPNLDDLARDGMKFLSFYAEPVCTPSRVALMTGRLPVRTGLDSVLFPGETKGLVAEEYTVAELLSDSGYHTAMFGKWHLGDQDEHQPTNQGFDYAFYTLVNGGVWPWKENAHFFDADNETVGEIPYVQDVPKDYASEFGIRVHGILESRKGEKPREVAALTLERYNVHDDELTDRVIAFIEKNAKSDKPFFVYFASNANQVFACPPEYRHLDFVDSGNCQAAQLAQHDVNVKRLMDKLVDLEIEENTLVVWMSDNGPMYHYFPSSGYSWLRGAKGSVYEGGIRVPAIASWPGVISPGQDPIDLIHITDWFLTAAHLAGGLDRIPKDRIFDSIDQTTFLFNGEGASRRNYMFHYRGPTLRAIRYGDIKSHINEREIYNIVRDPGEKAFRKGDYLWTFIPFSRMANSHKDAMSEFPNRVLPYDSALPELSLQD